MKAEVDDGLEMIHKLANSDRVRQVFVWHAFRYFLARNEMLSDGPLASGRSATEEEVISQALRVLKQHNEHEVEETRGISATAKR